MFFTVSVTGGGERVGERLQLKEDLVLVCSSGSERNSGIFLPLCVSQTCGDGGRLLFGHLSISFFRLS